MFPDILISTLKKFTGGSDMVILENTESNRQLAQVAASMAIENMYVSEEFIRELLKVPTGEKTTEEIRQEIIEKHAR
jgi:hypothetical protein